MRRIDATFLTSLAASLLLHAGLTYLMLRAYQEHALWLSQRRAASLLADGYDVSSSEQGATFDPSTLLSYTPQQEIPTPASVSNPPPPAPQPPPPPPPPALQLPDPRMGGPDGTGTASADSPGDEPQLAKEGGQDQPDLAKNPTQIVARPGQIGQQAAAPSPPLPPSPQTPSTPTETPANSQTAEQAPEAAQPAEMPQEVAKPKPAQPPAGMPGADTPFAPLGRPMPVPTLRPDKPTPSQEESKSIEPDAQADQARQASDNVQKKLTPDAQADKPNEATLEAKGVDEKTIDLKIKPTKSDLPIAATPPPEVVSPEIAKESKTAPPDEAKVADRVSAPAENTLDGKDEKQIENSARQAIAIGSAGEAAADVQRESIRKPADQLPVEVAEQPTRVVPPTRLPEQTPAGSLPQQDQAGSEKGKEDGSLGDNRTALTGSSPTDISPTEAISDEPLASATEKDAPEASVAAQQPAAASVSAPPVPAVTPTPGQAGDPQTNPNSNVSDRESDPFSKIGVVSFQPGRTLKRFGREVRTVRPRLGLNGQYDAATLRDPTVVLAVRTDATGKVTKVDVLKSSGSSDGIDLPTVNAVYQWYIEPPKDAQGNPMPDTTLWTLRWR